MGKVKSIVEKYKSDKTRLMDILLDIQASENYVSQDSIVEIARLLDISQASVEETVSFYHFFSRKPTGKYSVYLNNSLVSKMMGFNEVKKAFEKETGVKFGSSITANGQIGLYETACIGMNDQEPAAIINGVVFTKLDSEKVKKIVNAMKEGKTISSMITSFGDGANGSTYIKSMVNNNIQEKGQVLLNEFISGSALEKAIKMKSSEITEEIKISNLRGRGGAGFPTGMKWDFCAKSPKGHKVVICNADEGEPGTFKDRVILTERPHLLFEGMAICAHAIGAEEGILYLRNEYLYLKPHLENILNERRGKKLLGNNILDEKGYNFDIRIQLGAGAYVCGEETALIESVEGKRGEPRNRPPFPVESGYKENPTCVNNVETYCSAAKIILNGASWFKGFGTQASSGSKLISVSGDCEKPGVYELEWGFTVKDFLKKIGARDTLAVQVGGPSGVCIAENEFSRKVCFEDLPTGGSIIVIGKKRNIFEVVSNFMEFFIEESCGSCAPCRAGVVFLKKQYDKVLAGKGIEKDLKELDSLGNIIKTTSRCGLGQTAPNPILTTLKNFKSLYQEKINKGVDYISEFDMKSAVEASCKVAGRIPNIEE